MSLDHAEAIKLSCDQYILLYNQSAKMQQVISSFASSLKTALLLIPDNTLIPLCFETSEMVEVKDKFFAFINQLRGGIENKLSILFEVNHNVGSINLQSRKVIDLMKYESDRSKVTLLQLENQLRLKEKQITDCQNELEVQKLRHLQDKWKQQHYLAYCITKCQGNTQSYLQLLKQFRNKIDMQISFEKEEMTLISANIAAKLRELKAQMLKTWSLIDFHKMTLPSRKPVETQYQEKYSESQRIVLMEEKKIDGFQFDKLQHIKKKLKFLEQADISQSREYFSYSRTDSRQRVMEQSEVIGLLQA